MDYDYFYGQSGELFSYFRIPKALFQDSRFWHFSTDARTLYGILLDRMSLSAKNGWLDEQGRVYIIYTVREVQESLCCAEHKAVNGDAVLYTLESIMHRLSGAEQVVSEFRLVAPEVGQWQARRNPHRTFGRQSALLDFFCDCRQRQQVVVVVRSLIPLNRLPPGATNIKAPGKTLPGVGFVFSVACKPCRERAVCCFDGVVAVVDADNDTHKECLAFLIYK